MPRISAMRVAFAALLTLLCVPVAHAADLDGAAGMRIYRDGVLPSGVPLRGTVRNGVALSGAEAACAGCHRRSGLGGGEGQNSVRAIAGRLLFESPEFRVASTPSNPYRSAENRPAYTVATLARALREGVNPAGRPLDMLMPRYELSDDEVMQLASYLGQLSPASAPGVSDGEIHFATVIAPGMAPVRQQAMLDTLQAFFRDKNGGTRQETRRREIGRSVVGSEQMYRGHRDWQLHVWRLEGAPGTWAGQLERHYRQQPVFALLGGLGGGEWQPVHAFCERNEIPCLFPDVGMPVVEESAYSSFYFSRGPLLEVEVLAKHLADAGPGSAVTQVYRNDASGRALAQALRDALQRRGIASVTDRPLSGAATQTFWMRLLDADRPETLVLWLNDADLAEFPLRHEAPWPAGLYLSGSLVAQPDRFMQAEDWQGRVGIVYPFELQERLAPRMARMKAWLRARNVALADERVQAHAFFAATIAGDALAHMDENYSRDYFIERVEHMTEQSLFPAVYPRLSLGPGQRFASRGGHVAGATQEGALRALGGWIVP